MLEDFKLPDYQEMVILESTEEMVKLVKCSWDLEFKEKIIFHKNFTIWRMVYLENMMFNSIKVGG